ncbi:hypothetical protein GT347_13050 [Xylophilus rhododendri]|uniref:Uncharacterized protein n=1 Tax=Xylophilus rhododendri TaxID=2697032 RepID=A0A857J6H1_9BURK|nr:hypothetical protein [Xylophilus rhododendri]QHI98833.1 hypothetical protein GT347_13050 [Xylophilus rhododendri]
MFAQQPPQATGRFHQRAQPIPRDAEPAWHRSEPSSDGVRPPVDGDIGGLIAMAAQSAGRAAFSSVRGLAGGLWRRLAAIEQLAPRMHGQRHLRGNAARSRERGAPGVDFARLDHVMLHSLLQSPWLSGNTLASLLHIRDLVQRRGLAIGDLRGRLRPDGSFVPVGPLELRPAAWPGEREQLAWQNLDQMIALVRHQLRGGF